MVSWHCPQHTKEAGQRANAPGRDHKEEKTPYG